MLKKFLLHWQYGIKARVTDGALLAKIDTAIEPTYVRFDLAKIGSAVLAVQHRESDYELLFVHSRTEQTLIAKFETRDAAEVARGSIMCALVCGGQRRFRPAFRTTMGVLAAVLVVALILTTIAQMSGASQQDAANMMGAGMPAGPQSLQMQPTMPAPTAGEPMSADEFLAR